MPGSTRRLSEYIPRELLTISCLPYRLPLANKVQTVTETSIIVTTSSAQHFPIPGVIVRSSGPAGPATSARSPPLSQDREQIAGPKESFIYRNDSLNKQRSSFRSTATEISQAESDQLPHFLILLRRYGLFSLFLRASLSSRGKRVIGNFLVPTDPA